MNHSKTDPNGRSSGGSVGLVGATSIGIGGMVGGGIFAVLGVAAVLAGGATPLAFLLGGVLAALTAFSYSRLAVRYQSAGGTVAFVDRVFGVSEVTGSLNIVLWAGYIATSALYANAFGSYAATFFPGGDQPDPVLLRVLILLGIAVPWAINLTNAGLVARSEGVVVAIKMAVLLVVVAAGVPTMAMDRLAPASWPSAFEVIAAGMLIFVAYEGFELIANASDDVREPKQTLPRAFALSVGIVIVLYIAISAVVVGSMSPQRIEATADFALAEAASASLGQLGFVLVAVSAVLATFSAINATLYGSARLSFTIASEGELPAILEKRSWNQPIGLHITTLGGLAIAVSLPIDANSGLASAIFLIVFAVVNAAAVISAKGRVARSLSALGAVGCAGSLVVLLGRSIVNQPEVVWVLVTMLGGALALEHLYLRRGRPEFHG